MLEALKREVCEANLELVRQGLVFGTWGNASGFSRTDGLVVIKPSGVSYDEMRPEHMVVVDLDGNAVEGELRPSSDTRTHVELYKAFDGIGGIVHTHSHYATSWAQACRPIPCFGTTHADYFYGDVPLTECMTEDEIADDYERNTGHVIVRRFAGLDPVQYPGVLVANHGPFAWGSTPLKAAESAAVLEEIARMALDTVLLSPNQPAIAQALLDKHFLRKHGANAYYGQPEIA
ncbi:MAG: L-ribulose-5-phosphate 4-epimerase [FCB group bacterium]|jgi:L-ribulose-5-phosphate 4-epimerase|nr:L-ribulose-5-phosphate 4-epimerase [FCB group bacterium]